MELFQAPSCSSNGAQPINSYALVVYVPGALARFLDDLRCKLVPDCVPKAHVTVLPPRPVQAPVSAAWDHICTRLRETPPFEIEAGGVGIFRNTSVIYVELSAGRPELERIHAELNTGPLYFGEPHVYHPHITLAQDFPPADRERNLEQAEQLWAEYTGPRRFTVETVTFVQNTTANQWIDLASLHLGAVVTR